MDKTLGGRHGSRVTRASLGAGFAAAVLIAAAGGAAAEVVELRNGQRVEGTLQQTVAAVT